MDMLRHHHFPEHEINDSIIESSLPNGSDNNFEDLNVVKKTYSTIKFSSAC